MKPEFQFNVNLFHNNFLQIQGTNIFCFSIKKSKNIMDIQSLTVLAFISSSINVLTKYSTQNHCLLKSDYFPQPGKTKFEKPSTSSKIFCNLLTGKTDYFEYSNLESLETLVWLKSHQHVICFSKIGHQFLLRNSNYSYF